MKKILPAVIVTTYLVTIAVLIVAVIQTAMAEEYRFQRFTPQGVEQGTVRPWGHDAYKIETPSETTIIRIPQNPYKWKTYQEEQREQRYKQWQD